jgi:hypothetical protein
MSAELGAREKAFALAVGLGFLAAVASPAFRDPPYDSFPLSDYPMFSRGRPDTTLVLSQALGVMDDGRRVPLPPTISADTYEVLQSMAVIDQAIRSGREGAAAFCRAAAERARAAEGELEGVRVVELATSRFDVLRYYDGHPEPQAREVHVRCEVPR